MGGGGSNPADAEPKVDPSFGVQFEQKDITFDSNTLKLTRDDTAADVTPQWVSAVVWWSGEATVTSSLSMTLIVAGTSGSLAFPGPRWLTAEFGVSDPAVASYPLHHMADSVTGSAQVSYEDPAGAVGGDGQVAIEALNGTVTYKAPSGSFMGDAGELTAKLTFNGMKFALKDGTGLTAHGGVSLRAKKVGSPPPVADAGTDSSADSGGPCETMTGIGADGTLKTFEVTRVLKGNVVGVQFTCPNASFCYQNTWDLDPGSAGTGRFTGKATDPVREVTWGVLADPKAGCAPISTPGDLRRDYALLIKNTNGWSDQWSGWKKDELSSTVLTVTESQAGIANTYSHPCTGCYWP
jgi:hypothetical protein